MVEVDENADAPFPPQAVVDCNLCQKRHNQGQCPFLYDTVYLGAAEYGNELMTEIARAYFEAHPACRFVEVHEHGGWYLGYCRDLTIWSTANDRAILFPTERPVKWSGREERR